MASAAAKQALMGLAQLRIPNLSLGLGLSKESGLDPWIAKGDRGLFAHQPELRVGGTAVVQAQKKATGVRRWGHVHQC
jgi:hypothetical protein